jgi:hypothetical protein
LRIVNQRSDRKIIGSYAAEDRVLNYIAENQGKKPFGCRLARSLTGCPQASLSEAGSIVEAGSREALIEKGGRFAEYGLQRRQAQDWRLV